MRTKHLTKVFSLTLLLGGIGFPLVGCGRSDQLTAVTHNADADALAEYDRLEAENERAGQNDGSE